MHNIWSIRFNHSNIPIVAFIEYEEVPLGINPHHLRRIEKVLSLRAIFKAFLSANASICIDVFLIYFQPPHTVIIFVCYVSDSRIGCARVRKVFLLWGKCGKRDVFDSAKVQLSRINHLVVERSHFISLISYLSLCVISCTVTTICAIS